MVVIWFRARVSLSVDRLSGSLFGLGLYVFFFDRVSRGCAGVCLGIFIKVISGLRAVTKAVQVSMLGYFKARVVVSVVMRSSVMVCSAKAMVKWV